MPWLMGSFGLFVIDIEKAFKLVTGFDNVIKLHYEVVDRDKKKVECLSQAIKFSLLLFASKVGTSVSGATYGALLFNGFCLLALSPNTSVGRKTCQAKTP